MSSLTTQHAPLGYRWDPDLSGALAQDPASAAAVRQAFALAQQGVPAAEIAAAVPDPSRGTEDGSTSLRSIRPDHVAIYVRRAVRSPFDGTTVDLQRDNCEAFVREHGWHVREDLVFVDDGYSGTTLDRPALSRLRELIAAGEIDAVVTYRLDRISRQVIHVAQLLLDEWGARCPVWCVADGISTADVTGRSLLYIMHSFADHERQVSGGHTAAGGQAANEQRTRAADQPSPPCSG